VYADLGLISLGIVLLYLGGESLVTGATSIARASGLRPAVVGLTVIAFGTSAPELAATMAAAFRGAPEIAFGNVVGSNIANLGLILGIAALIQPIRAHATFLRREVPFMIGTTVAMLLIVHNDFVGRVEGTILFGALILYLWVLLRDGRSNPSEPSEQRPETVDRKLVWSGLARVTFGILLLVLGARWLVAGAVGVATTLEIDDRIIGLTLVALGTSLPELASVMIAAMRRQSDLILGNLVGSNIFNILCILSLTALVRPLNIDAAAARGDLLVMMVFTVAVWPFMYGLRIGRKRGVALLGGYLLYVVWLVQ